MKKEIITISQIVIISVLLVAFGFWAFKIGLERQERYECRKWAEEASKLKGYYLTEWQKKQCEKFR